MMVLVLYNVCVKGPTEVVNGNALFSPRQFSSDEKEVNLLCLSLLFTHINRFRVVMFNSGYQNNRWMPSMLIDVWESLRGEYLKGSDNQKVMLLFCSIYILFFFVLRYLHFKWMKIHQQIQQERLVNSWTRWDDMILWCRVWYTKHCPSMRAASEDSL